MRRPRNVLDHIPEEQHAWVRHKTTSAWSEPDAGKVEEALKALASVLEKDHPGAAASLREGLEETATVNRLVLSAALWLSRPVQHGLFVNSSACRS